MSIKTKLSDLVETLVVGERFYIMIPPPGDEKNAEYAVYRNAPPEGLEVTNNAYWDLVRTGATARSREDLISKLVKAVLTVVNIALAHECGKILVFDGTLGQTAETQWTLTSVINAWINFNEEEQPSSWGVIFDLDSASCNISDKAFEDALSQLDETIRIDFRVEPVPRD